LRCEIIAPELEAFVDCELDAEAAVSIRDHVHGCEDCRHRVADLQMLGRLLRATPYHPAPSPLRSRVVTRANRSSSIRTTVSVAALAAVLMVTTAAAFNFVRFGGSSSDDRATEEVVSGHVRSLMGDHLFDVRSTDQHIVKPWFLGKLAFSPPTTDLAAQGFPLVGGRLDFFAGRPVAALVYRRQQHTINLFIAQAAGDAAGGIRSRSSRGFHIRQWNRDGMSFWAVSDLNDGELTQFVRAMNPDGH